MILFIKRLIFLLGRRAELITGVLEAIIFGAFATTLLLSFYGQLNAPVIYGAVFLILIAFFLVAASALKSDGPPQASPDAAPMVYYIIACALAFLLLDSLFTPPYSSDGLRIKMVRMMLGVDDGSALATSRVDSISVMYLVPAAYYFIFTPIEALHLPDRFYSMFNTALMIGSLLNLWMLYGRNRSVQTFFPLLLFLAAPQFLFSALSEHEEALTFFLSTRAAFWLIARPLHMKTIFFGTLSAAFAAEVKYPTAVFLPFMLPMLAFYFGGKERIIAWLRPKTIVTALIFLVPITLIMLIPDVLIDASRGLTYFGQLHKISLYHVTSPLSCGFAHFALRMFEFLPDIPRTVIDILNIKLTQLLPAYDFLPRGCSPENTTWASLMIPNLLTRETVQFGALPLLPIMGLFFARGENRRMVILSLSLFILSVLFYCFCFTYWWGTGRYVMVGFLTLLPAFIITLGAIQSRFGTTAYYLAVCFVLLPALMLAVRSDISLGRIPYVYAHSDIQTERMQGIVGALKTVEGKTNIYFNDIMMFSPLMRVIPSKDITLKREIMPDATNIIPIPNEYSPATNWHDSYWILPIPSVHGDFVFMGPVLYTFGNRVPTSFYMNKTPKFSASETFDVKFYDPDEDLVAWARSLGTDYRIVEFALRDETGYFIHVDGNPTPDGLCVRRKNRALTWSIATLESCKGQ